MKRYDRITSQIIEIEFVGRLDHFRMLSHEHPAAVGEKERAARVVRVAVRIGELVMDSMTGRPIEDCEHAGCRVAEHQEHFERERCPVAAMRPQFVTSDDHASAAPQNKRKTCERTNDASVAQCDFEPLTEHPR